MNKFALFDTLVTGAGPVGLTAALALSERTERKIAVIDNVKILSPQPYDQAWALSRSVIQNLADLNIDVTPYSAEINEIIADTKSHHKPALSFLDKNSGRNVISSLLKKDLWQQVSNRSNIHIINDKILGVEQNLNGNGNSTVTLRGAKNSYGGRLVVGADGKKSGVRKGLGIGIHTHHYNQTAVTAIVKHTNPHRQRAVEFFMPAGPLAMIPYPGDRGEGNYSTLVWSVNNDSADAFLAQSIAAQESLLTRLLEDIYGACTYASAPPLSFPLQKQKATESTGQGWVLIGDASQSIHPVAGQGLNVGLRDAFQLASYVAQSEQLGLKFEEAVNLKSYEASRQTDRTSLASSTDFLVRLHQVKSNTTRRLSRFGMGLVDKNIAGIKNLVTKFV